MRASQQPLTLAEEQAAAALSLMERRDIAAALRLSLNDDWDSDEEKSGAESDSDAEADMADVEEEKQPAAVAHQAHEWSSELHDIKGELPRLRHQRQQPPSDDASAFDLLQLFLPRRLMEEFAHHTNIAAPHDWRHTTVQELYAFLGVHLFMGIDRLPRTEMYWSSTFGHPLITSLFSRDRFKQLIRFFRVVEPDDATAVRNPLPHIAALAEKLNASFAAHYVASRFLAIDEAMCAYKGRSPIKQYIPLKPHKWGYKIYCLSSDGYLLRFEVYAGKEEERSAEGATYDTVMRLIKGYENKQHTLFTDNWFTSPALLNALQQKDIRLCGSVRSNRRGMPIIPKEEVSALGQGQWIQRQSGDMSLAVWKDQKAVWVLYNHCSPRETASLDRWSDAGNKVAIGCPRAIHDYFYHARSVDVLSQLHYSYLPGRKARRCWPRLAWWLLDMCIINAFKLWSIGQTQVSQLRFREDLMYELLKQLPSEDKPHRASKRPSPADSPAKDHYSERSSTCRECSVCSNRNSGKRTETRYICHACGTHLCIGACFSAYHNSS